MSSSTPVAISSKHLIDNINEGILVLDSTYKIIFVSNFFLTLTNFDQSDLIGQSIDIIFPEKAEGLKFIIQCNDRKPTDKLYSDVLTKEKKRIPVRISIANDKGKDDHSQCLVFIKDGSNYQRIRKDILRKALAIETLSKSRKIRDGKLADAINEILQIASRAVNTERVNAWLFDIDHSKIECIGNYESSANKMVKQQSLTRIEMPSYFRLFETEMIIITSDAMNDPVTEELRETYLKPNRIHSLMDIPIRVEGEIIGVVCFEHCDTPRVWNIQEQKFGLVIAQMLSLALETSAKQKARNKLEVALKEQKVLLQEVNHRVKNNLTIVSSLLNLQAAKAKDAFHKDLFYQSKDRVNSIAAVHQLLYQSESYSKVNFKNYVEEIMNNLHSSFSNDHKKISIKKELSDVQIDVSTAIPLALIVNELVTNSYKHAFEPAKEGTISISLEEKNDEVHLMIKDNGPGYDFEKASDSSVGMDIIRGLAEQINATVKYTNGKGSTHDIRFKRSK
ncbi:MAG: ATP-binding protein [Bacteroidetes bacterium]|nr:ATP-binding protein [Bacteroidota bacterium]